ncbi:autotransporter domain-containing protein [Asticcacaulis sp. BYS171W]|uniref:Autotransporter domain-containing protein n=1 Tax=Asticcacaulis aquaticus TaxID=2984212 RepID=A0ABT5HNV9_9CAUL|nr:autotransporter outer membrane beta-barrel domain-containing protein [Asticcacaulis aquaticus]MDC7681750.1 autotransporter domain-containing protein [Asticcacaulis aquaticus]
MRKSHLFNATALGLVMAVALGAQAQAETSITTATTTPVRTATIGTGGTADDINITSAGTITLKDANARAVTIDSNNKLTMAGAIDMSASGDNATAIYVDGGRTGSVSVSGKITVTDDYTPTDTDSPVDGITDGAFATGTGRYAFRSAGTTPYVGNIDFLAATTTTTGSVILVEGNNSYGVRFENALTGNLTHKGSLTVVGNNARGFSFENAVTGRLIIGGSVGVLGEGATALNLTGGVNGAVIIDGTIAGSGYRLTSIPDQATLDKLQAEDKLQAGPLINIASNITQGLLIQSAITNTDAATVTTPNNDEDGNGIDDTLDGAASLSQFGGAAALRIGSATQDITLNAINIASTATDLYKDQKFGLVVRGSVTSAGVLDGIAAKAIETGGLGRTVLFENGILIAGSVSSSSYLAENRAVSLLSGTQAAKFNVSGLVKGTAASKTNQTAYGIYIGTGANVPELNIAGSVQAAGIGSKSNATAIFDASNLLARVTNTGNISASLTATDDDGDGVIDTSTNRAVAIDTRGNTLGLTLTQTDLKPDDDTVAAPFITGDILLGSGADVLNINGGFILGNIDFGGGANSLTINTKAIVAGKMTGSGTVNLDIVNGSLNLALGSRLNLSQLNVRKDGTLRFIPDTTAPGTALLVSAGPAVFETGAKVQIGMSKIVKAPTRYTLLTASSITLGTLDTASLDANIPYLYKAALSTDTAKTSLFADVRLRTQSETTLTANEFAAFDAIMTAAQGSTGATNALLDPITATGFEKAYLSFLPDYSGETLLSLAKGNDALSRTLASQSVIPPTGENQYWLQEYGYQVTRDRAEVTGFDARGFAFAGGVERGLTSTQAAGLYLGYTAASPSDTFASPEEDMTATDLSLGVYWRLDTGSGLKSWVRAGAGYTKLESTRQILEGTFISRNEATWNGVSYSGSVGASYGFEAGWLSLTPLLSADYYGLKEDAHTETGGDVAFDLSVEERTSHILSGSAILNIGRSDKNALFRPELWVGYRNNFSVEIGDTVARYGTQTPFTLHGGTVEGGGPVAGLRIAASNEYSYFGIEGEYEKQDAYENVSLSLRARFQF